MCAKSCANGECDVESVRCVTRVLEYVHSINYCIASAIFCLFFSPADRSVEDVEAIFDELQHMEVFASFPTAVKRQLARVVVFEHHAGVGTVGESRKSVLT